MSIEPKVGGLKMQGGFIMIAKFYEKWDALRIFYQNDPKTVAWLVIGAVVFATISAGIMGIPARSLWVGVEMFGLSIVVLFMALVLCMPSIGISNSLVTPIGLMFTFISLAWMIGVVIISIGLYGW